MSRYEIVPCRLAHIAVLVRTLRADDRAEIEGAGLHVKHFLMALYRQSGWRRTALVDGEVACCWGDRAPPLSTDGHMWLLTAPPIERIPLAFFRETRRQVAERLQIRSVLRADTAAGYTRAQRFFAMMGFEILPIGSDGDETRREMTISREGV